MVSGVTVASSPIAPFGDLNRVYLPTGSNGNDDLWTHNRSLQSEQLGFGSAAWTGSVAISINIRNENL